jgi:hypothetical protein
MPVVPHRRGLFRDSTAVTEVLGEMLLTAIVVLAFAVVITFVMFHLNPVDSSRVDVSAWADADKDTIYFRHVGGETLDTSEIELLLDLNGTVYRINSSLLSSSYNRDIWEYGDVIALNVSSLFGDDITEGGSLESKLIHTSSNMVFFDSLLYGGDSYYSGSSGSSGNLQAPVLTDPHPANLSCTSSVLEPVTFNATSSQASYNEFLLDGVRVAWSNGTFPSYTNTPLSAGTHTLTLVAHNTTDPSLTDSITWEWTVTGMPGIYADRLILNKNDIGGVIKDGGYISFTNEGEYRYITIDGTQYDLNPGDSVKLEIVNDQTSGQIDMNIGSAQISTFDFNVNLYINGDLVDSGNVTDLYVQPISDFISTLRYELPSHDSWTSLEADGNTIISGTNDSAINIYNIGFYSPDSTVLTFNPSDTYLKCSGYYEILPESSGNLQAPVLTGPRPAILSYTSSVLEPVTFNATSSQASYNEFLLNGVRVAWSNGTSPSYTNTPFSAGTYYLTLVAHNTTDPSLTDSITWEWTVTGMPGIYADRLILNKNDIGGVIKDGGYISFTNEGDSRYITIDGTQYDLASGDSVKLEIVNDQTSGQIDMNIGSAQISTFDFNVNLYINGDLEATGDVSSLYVQPISDFSSTLRYELSSYDSWTSLEADGNTIISGTNDSAINIYNIGFYSPGSTVLTFNPSSTYLACSGYYEILPASSPSLPSPVSLWTFNSSNADDAIDGNDGSTVRQVEWGTGVGGTTGIVVSGDDYVTVPDSDNLDLSDEGSIAAWIYMNEFIEYAGIVHKGHLKSFSDEAYSLQMWNNRKVRFGINQLNPSVYSTTTLNEGQWYHLVGTWNSSSVNLYIDGEPDSSAANPSGVSAPDTSGSLQIGAQITETDGSKKNYGFDGSIDEVAIYDYALNATEVEQLYNQY